MGLEKDRFGIGYGGMVLKKFGKYFNQ